MKGRSGYKKGVDIRKEWMEGSSDWKEEMYKNDLTFCSNNSAKPEHYIILQYSLFDSQRCKMWMSKISSPFSNPTF